jgi:hypothetical protein
MQQGPGNLRWAPEDSVAPGRGEASARHPRPSRAAGLREDGGGRGRWGRARRHGCGRTRAGPVGEDGLHGRGIRDGIEQLGPDLRRRQVDEPFLMEHGQDPLAPTEVKAWRGASRARDPGGGLPPRRR